MIPAFIGPDDASRNAPLNAAVNYAGHYVYADRNDKRFVIISATGTNRRADLRQITDIRLEFVGTRTWGEYQLRKDEARACACAWKKKIHPINRFATWDNAGIGRIFPGYGICGLHGVFTAYPLSTALFYRYVMACHAWRAADIRCRCRESVTYYRLNASIECARPS